MYFQATSEFKQTEGETGQHDWYGIDYDKCGELEPITLNHHGVHSYQTQDETVEDIVQWLKGVLVETDLDGT